MAVKVSLRTPTSRGLKVVIQNMNVRSDQGFTEHPTSRTERKFADSLSAELTVSLSTPTSRGLKG